MFDISDHGIFPKKKFFFRASYQTENIYFVSKISICISVCNTFFSGLAHYFFLIFWIKSGFNKHYKVTKNSCFAQSGVNGPCLAPKATLSNFSPKLCLGLFLKLYMIKVIKCVKVTEMGHFWTQNQHFTLDLLIRLF